MLNASKNKPLGENTNKRVETLGIFRRSSASGIWPIIRIESLKNEKNAAEVAMYARQRF